MTTTEIVPLPRTAEQSLLFVGPPDDAEVHCFEMLDGDARLVVIVARMTPARWAALDDADREGFSVRRYDGMVSAVRVDFELVRRHGTRARV